ncbi:MAG: NAD(P)-binding protein [Proteobacteria bacterium]|nr:NAD(P)-binding protein [Pseudomonadota bacterium]
MKETNDKIAIIGGGIAGLTASYLLNQKHDITLFEKSERVGGNAYTFQTGNGESIDIAVAAYSKLVSKNFLKLLKKLKVKTTIQPASALLSIHDLEANDGIYLTPLNLKGLIAQKFAIFRPALFYELSMAIMGMRKANRFLDEGKFAGLSVEQAFEMIPELKGKRLPVVMAPLCLLSSMYYQEVMEGPAEFFLNKQKAFKCFTAFNQMFGLKFPKNLTRSYVQALASNFKDKIILNSKIKSIARQNNAVTLKMEDGRESVFDKVVFACNADQALSLLEKPNEKEKRLLGAWKYKEGLMVVHKDNTHFPKRELCQSWTCLQNTRNGKPHFSITCCTWRICPAVSKKSEYLSTQHPNFPIRENSIELEKYFRTPIFDFNSYPTIEELPSLNGIDNSFYCGSHFGYGLHNDAVTSAIEVAKKLGIEWK